MSSRKTLVIGSGGREHAIAWRLSRDSDPPAVFCAPGNAGTAEVATNVDIGAEDMDGLVAWAVQHRPDLTVVGPEAPLCAGIADRFQREGLRVFGPRQAAAQLEGSKAFSKSVMLAAGVPTARAWTCTSLDDAIARIRACGAPVVVKADGLAAGKGVRVCATTAEAESSAREFMVDRVFGRAGSTLLVEECLQGEEASILALVDGERIVMLASSQDHKRVFDGDKGPNTGGMGAYSPAPVVTDALWPVIRREVFERTLAELTRRGILYRGVLYAGIMVTADGPKVLEFNCRFGDPETQAVLARLRSDLYPALQACADGRLDEHMVAWRREPAVCVVMASGGYPDHYEKGKPIEGISLAGQLSNVTVFHAGTRRTDSVVVTAGGRVLGVTATARDLPSAVRQAYRAVARIRFEGAHFRHDIGARALARRSRI